MPFSFRPLHRFLVQCMSPPMHVLSKGKALHCYPLLRVGHVKDAHSFF